MLTLGTSGGFLVAACRKCAVQGTSSMTENGDLPGYFSYASGQACLGDCFGWFAKHMVPGECVQEAKEKKMPVQSLLMEKAAKLTPGESGLLALDWWNGNRSVLADAELSGLILGMTLKTRSEEIYRALLESAAFGTRRILESYEQAGLPVKKIHAVGGIVKKNPLLMQIYADVLNCPIYTCKSTQAAALGSAMFAAAAAGAKKGGYDTVREAVIHMSELEETPYLPIPEHAELYGKLYQEFCRLHDYFGCGGNDVMKQLKKIQCGNR